LPRSRTVCRRRMPEMFVVTSQGVRHAAGCSVPDHTISTPPENTSVAPACWVRGLAARIQRYTTWERGLPARLQRYATWVRRRLARMPGAQASRPHTAIHPITPAPPGCAGVSPACRVRGHRARIQQYTPSPLHRLGARASRPHAGCAGFQPAYRDTPPGCAGVSPACWVRGRLARIQRCATWVRGLPARIPRYTTWVRGLPARIPRHTTWVRGRLARMPRAEGHTWQWQWVLDQSLTS